MDSRINDFFYSQLQTGDREDFNRTHVTLENDVDNIKDAILVIQHAELTDRNYYNCTARNIATGFKGFEEATDGTYVRVKGMHRTVFECL